MGHATSACLLTGLLQVHQSLMSCGPLDVEAAEAAVKQLQDSIKQRVCHGSAPGVSSAQEVPKTQQALLWVYTAVMVLSKTACLLVEQGVSIAHLYLRHLSDHLPQ